MQVVNVFFRKHTERRYDIRRGNNVTDVKEILSKYINMKECTIGGHSCHLMVDIHNGYGVRGAYSSDISNEMAMGIALIYAAHYNETYTLKEIELNEDYMQKGFCNMIVHLRSRYWKDET